MTKKPANYQALTTELDTIIAELQREDTDVDVALKQYERGLELVTELQQHLKTAENRITQLKASFAKTTK